MVTARVLHFGSDDCHRVEALRQVGYKVRVSVSLDQLRQSLQSNDDVHAVMVAEGARATTLQAATIVRQFSVAPLILFRRYKTPLSKKLFDRVYSPSVPAANWLFETAVLVEQCRELLAEHARLISKAKRLHGEIEAIWQESKQEMARAAVERRRNRGPAKPWHELPEKKEPDIVGDMLWMLRIIEDPEVFSPESTPSASDQKRRAASARPRKRSAESGNRKGHNWRGCAE